MDRPRTLRLPLRLPLRLRWPFSFPMCALVSLGLHAAALQGLHRAKPPPTLSFEPAAAAPTIAGDTLDVESAPEEPGEPEAPGDMAPAAPLPSAPGPRAAPAGGARAAAMLAGSPTRTTIYGAVGVRFATDLATTFTRAFPQAASADPAWESAAFGSAGAAEVTLILDDDGHITTSAITGGPSLALRRGIERTLALVGPRTFTAHEAVTTIRVTARVTRDDVHDGLHGDVFALSGGSFSGDLGSAFFALPPGPGPGRRIDVDLRLVPLARLVRPLRR